MHFRGGGILHTDEQHINRRKRFTLLIICNDIYINNQCRIIYQSEVPLFVIIH